MNEPKEQQTPLDVTTSLQATTDPLQGETTGYTSQETSELTRMGDYRLIRRLGKGGMGDVFEAQHVDRQERVALKMLPADGTGQALQYFKREFRSLATIHHRHLVAMHTLERDGERWFLTMDLVDGVNFRRYVRPAGKLHEQRLRAKLQELVLAIAYLHSRGIIHRDLKPGNVLVDRDGRLVVLDFGLVRELKQEHAQQEGFIEGTVAYMSPQQAQGQVSTAACDWYAVGTMLYEALSGRLPFSGKAIHTILHAKRSQPAPPLDGNGPADLSALALQLLERNPEDRPSQEEIFEHLAIPLEQQPDAHAVRLVGRDSQLRQLRDAFEECQGQREARLVHVSGKSGEGKSSLIDEFLQTVRANLDVIILSGRCYDRESVPFKAIDSIIDGICHYLRQRDPGQTPRLLPDDIHLLAQLFPVLSRVELIAEAIASQPAARGLDDRQLRLRAFQTLRLLLSRMAGDQQTLVLVIDDLQWGDADSAAALFEVLKPPCQAALLVIGAFRSDELEQSRFLQHYNQLAASVEGMPAPLRIEVGQFSESQLQELIASAIEVDAGRRDELLETILRETQGNPYLVVQLLESLQLEGQLLTFRNLHEVINAKLGALPDQAITVLKHLAVYGRSMLVEELAEAAGTQSAISSTLTHMRSEKLVRLLSEERQEIVDTYHDRIREEVLGTLPSVEKRGCHLALAEAIEQRGGGVAAEDLQSVRLGQETLRPRLFDLSSHFDGAGQQEKARYYGLLAAEQAKRQSAGEVAGEHYAIARRNADGAPRPIQYRIAAGYAGVLYETGRLDDTSRELDRADQFAGTIVEKAKIQALRASLAMKQRPEDVLSTCTDTLRGLGIRVPRTSVGFALGIVKEWLTRVLSRKRAQQPEVHDEKRQLALRLVNRIAMYYVDRNSFRFVWTALKSWNLSQSLCPSSDTATACIVFGAGLYFHLFGRCGPGIPFIEQGLEQSRQNDDKLQLAHVAMRGGMAIGIAGDFAKAREWVELAQRNFAALGVPQEQVLTMAILAHIYGWKGDLAEAIKLSRYTFGLWRQHGRRFLNRGFLLPWAIASEGRFPFEQLKPYFEQDSSLNPALMMAEACWHSANQRYADAVDSLERGWHQLTGSLLINQYWMSILPMTVTAQRQHAESLHSTDPGQANRLFRRAYRRARFTALISRFFPRQIPHAYRELAILSERRGRLSKAFKQADWSCANAEKQGARFEYAQSLLVRGRIAGKLGKADAAEQMDAAERELATIREEANRAMEEVGDL